MDREHSGQQKSITDDDGIHGDSHNIQTNMSADEHKHQQSASFIRKEENYSEKCND